jgi:hypothetical protein
MKKRYILLLIIALLVSGYLMMWPSYTYKYRMTVEVSTPEGIKTGSSVIEVTTHQWPKFLSGITAGNTTESSAVGEAPFVDLGARGMLFATLKY